MWDLFVISCELICDSGKKKKKVGGDIFLRKTATSFFEHTFHIHRSSKITHTALNMKKNGFLCFCCCFDVCSDFEVVY